MASVSKYTARLESPLLLFIFSLIPFPLAVFAWKINKIRLLLITARTLVHTYFQYLIFYSLFFRRFLSSPWFTRLIALRFQFGTACSIQTKDEHHHTIHNIKSHPMIHPYRIRITNENKKKKIHSRTLQSSQ